MNNYQSNMLLAERYAIELTVVTGMTAIIPTYNSSPRLFALSLLSLLYNSQDVLVHVIVTINGPDKRTGDPECQNQKQAFLEALREKKYRCEPMPLTVQRTWSRVGHAQALDSAMPWVHTRDILVMHDDVILLDPAWGGQVTRCLNNPDAGLVVAGDPKALNRITWGPWEDGKMLINFPHPKTHFLAARKSVIGTYRWAGQWVKNDFKDIDTSTHTKYWQNAQGQVLTEDLPTEAGYMTYDIGSWLMFYVQEDHKQIISIPEDTVLHLAGISWQSDRQNDRKVHFARGIIDHMEVELREQMPDLFKVYYDMFGDYRFC